MKDFNEILAQFFGDVSDGLADPAEVTDALEALLKKPKAKKAAQPRQQAQESQSLTLFADSDKHTKSGTDTRPTKTLYTPTGEELLSMQKGFMQYTVADLKIMAQPYLIMARKYHLTSKNESQRRRVENLIHIVCGGSGTLKKDWVNFMVIFSHINNFMVCFEELPPKQQELLKVVAEKHYICKQEASKILGKSFTRRGVYDYRDHLVDGLDNWLQSADADDYYYYSRKSEIYGLKKASAYQTLLLHCHPDMAINEHLEELPKGEQLLTFSNERDILRKLNILEMLYQSGKLEIGRTKLTASVFTHARKSVGFKEFFPDTIPNLPTPYCAHLAINLYALYRTGNKKAATPTAPANVIRDIIEQTPKEPTAYIPIVMSHLKGLKKKEIEYAEPHRPLINLQRELCLHADKGWIAADKLLFNTRTRKANDENDLFFVDYDDLDVISLQNEFTNEKAIGYEDLTEQFFLAFVQANLFVLAALGVLEIAYTVPRPNKDTSPFAGIKYVRLTNLGRYVLRIDKTYEMPKEEENGYFELDDSSLFIKSTTDDNPFTSLLKDFAIPITAKLFKVSYASFLNGCSTKKDITDRIDLFKQYVCAKPPKNWQQFFKELSSRCKLLKKPDTQYEILTIPKEQKELQRILLTDPNIRPYIKKAEDYTILIDTKNKKKVADRLTTYGYLL